MAKHRKRLIVALAAGAAVSAVAIGSSAYINRTPGAYSEATDNVRVVDDRKPPEQWAINAAYGRGVLSNLQAALTKIANDDFEEAAKGVAVAQSLLARISPESRITTVDSSDHEADLILVHSEVRVLGVGDPTKAVQTKLDSIRHELVVTDHEAIIAVLDAWNIPLAYTRVDLPLAETVALVDEVLQALDSHDADRARTKLMEVGNGLRVETVQVGTEASRGSSDHEDEAG